MDISSLFQGIVRLWERRAALPETLLDGWIEDALREEAFAQPSDTTWERLRQLLEGRRRRRYGMWVLDEPLHDPPRAFMSGIVSPFPRATPWERYRAAQPYMAENVVTPLTFALAAFINY